MVTVCVCVCARAHAHACVKFTIEIQFAELF